MARGDSLTRLLKLAQLIDRRRAFDIAGVAEELGSSERTIYRLWHLSAKGLRWSMRGSRDRHASLQPACLAISLSALSAAAHRLPLSRHGEESLSLFHRIGSAQILLCYDVSSA